MEVRDPKSIRRPNAVTLEIQLSWPDTRKTCPDCDRELLAREDFHVHTYYPCGMPRTWVPYCKDCQRERVRWAATLRRRRNGVPERDSVYKIRNGYRGSSKADSVEAGPFVRWLREAIRKAGGPQNFARSVKVDEGRVRAALEQKRVSLSLVDRWLHESGSEAQLWELYDLPEDGGK